jgi:two-component system alkaline phosphatase synthesis response regulator PhoP
MKESILLVEDEEDLRIALSDRLQSEGYVVHTAASGEEGYECLAQIPLDLVVLDIMLPGKSGLDVCRDIRQDGFATPILMLTARAQTTDKIVGLKLGADDYVTKPFEMAELLARIEALLRRSNIKAPSSSDVQQFGSLRVDFRGTEVHKDGKLVNLSAREFQLLRHFIENSGRTLSRTELLKEVWGYDTATFTRTVDVHISSLRQKLEPDPKNPSLIITVLRLGYKFVA